MSINTNYALLRAKSIINEMRELKHAGDFLSYNVYAEELTALLFVLDEGVKAQLNEDLSELRAVHVVYSSAVAVDFEQDLID